MGAAYSASLSASGGAPPYAWALESGALPAGLALAIDGSLSGTPTLAGLSVFVVRVTDTAMATLTATLGISIIENSGAVQITTASLPAATIGVAYNVSLSAAGGAAPYTWNVASGALPDGLAVDPSGAISGVPSAVGTFSFAAQVVDSSAPQGAASRLLSITVAAPALSIVTTSLPDGVAGDPYSATIVASGGAAPLTFDIAAGALPMGLSLDAATGVISGTPLAAETATFTVRVSDATSSVVQAYTVRITPASSAFAISTTALPSGITGAAYSASLAASGGAQPYIWDVNSGALPPGLSIDASGAIMGTPSADGSYAFTLRATDSAMPPRQATRALTIDIVDPLQIARDALPDGEVGLAYSATIRASGGATPYALSVSPGALPPGIQMSASGVLSGAPTQAGTFGFTVFAADASSPAQSTSESFTITITGPLTIVTTVLDDGIVGVGYSDTVIAAGGTPPYAWSGTGMPAGLSLDPATGRISSTPAASGTFSISIAVRDASPTPRTAMATVGITITAPAALAISTRALPGGVTGQAYSDSLNAIGGTSPYAWSVTSGALPAGVSLDPTTGALAGTPSVAGIAMLTVTVTDAAMPAQTASRALSIAITGPLAVSTASLPDGVTGALYSATLAGSGGTTPYAWSIAAGALPAGLSLDPASGALRGTPASPGSFGVTVRVVDASRPSQSATRTLAITIAEALTITTASLPNGSVNSAYSSPVVASGGTTPYVFSISQGTLPPGLTLSASSGVLSGTPTTTGPLAFTVRVTDGSAPPQSATRSYSVFVNGEGILTITTASLPDAVAGRAYSATLGATGGTTPYAWTLAAGPLPAGVTLSAGGVLSGTPTTPGAFTFTVRANDGSMPRQSAQQRRRSASWPRS